MSLTITWDGTITDRESIDNNVYIGATNRFWKVSDKVLTQQDFVDATFVYSDGTEQTIDSFVDYGQGLVVGNERVISGYGGKYYKVDDEEKYITLPSDGTYFNRNALMSTYVASATFPNAENVPVLEWQDKTPYRRMNNQWVKQDTYRRENGKWVKQDEYRRE